MGPRCRFQGIVEMAEVSVALGQVIEKDRMGMSFLGSAKLDGGPAEFSLVIKLGAEVEKLLGSLDIIRQVVSCELVWRFGKGEARRQKNRHNDDDRGVKTRHIHTRLELLNTQDRSIYSQMEDYIAQEHRGYTATVDDRETTVKGTPL